MENLLARIESGKQVGKCFQFSRRGQTFFSSVGIQKWDDVFIAYVDEIEESQMASGTYEREEFRKFLTAEDAIAYVAETTDVAVDDLLPCKGQRMFNPRFG